MSPSIAKAISGDLSAFNGAEIAGSIPIRESLLNEELQRILAIRRGPVQQAVVRIGTDNLIECNVQVSVGPFAKWFRPRILLQPQLLWERRPTLVLTMASSQYVGLMWIARTFAAQFFPRGVTVAGTEIVVRLDELPQLGPARGILQYLRKLSAHSSAAVIYLDFDLKVSQI